RVSRCKRYSIFLISCDEMVCKKTFPQKFRYDPSFLYPPHGNRPQQHKYSPKQNSIYWLTAKQVLDNHPPEETAHNLREGYEKVEDAHIHTHFMGWQAVTQDGIRHRENASPGNTDAEHRQQ